MSVVNYLAACGLALSAVAVQAQPLQLPQVEDAAQAALLQEANTQYQGYLAAPDNYFHAEAAGRWPCAVPAKLVQDLTGTSDYAGRQGGKAFGHKFSKVAVHPVVAECRGGKLDGVVELVYEATRQAWGPGFKARSQETGRVVATIKDGRVIHRTELRRSVNGGDVSVASSAETPAGAFITSATTLVAGGAQKFFLKRPVAGAGGPRQEKSYYEGTRLVTVEQADARGRPDGRNTSNKGGAEKSTCFRHGKEIACAG
ncbi:hypothetical protein [Herbaspirillum robiniae]|uniref:hypothetical protein n=1 Tax=Herbaspirillum robiniae TaxID=2014887 RepID=UPI0009A16DC7|nr:hypothetical protein [Herbaspirillum robiniae]